MDDVNIHHSSSNLAVHRQVHGKTFVSHGIAKILFAIRKIHTYYA